MSEFDKCKYDLKLTLVGFLVALFSAGIGIGGGILLVSILISVFRFDFKKAASTSLATIIPISFVGSVSYFVFLPEIPHLQYYFTFIPACVFGTILGIGIVRNHPNWWFKSLFSFFLIIISMSMLRIFDFPALIYRALDSILYSNEWLLIVPVGIFIGIIAVALGIGCGLLIVPFYVIVINLNIHEAIALSLATMFFLTLSATMMNNRFKMLDTNLLKTLLIPALSGAIIGAIISGHLPAQFLKIIFGILLFIIALYYIIQEISIHFKPAVFVNKFLGKY